jgi:hypothetical protein
MQVHDESGDVYDENTNTTHKSVQIQKNSIVSIIQFLQECVYTVFEERTSMLR